MKVVSFREKDSMTKVLGMIMSVAMLVALAGCAAADKGGAQKQASEQPAAAKVSSEGREGRLPEGQGLLRQRAGCLPQGEGCLRQEVTRSHRLCERATEH